MSNFVSSWAKNIVTLPENYVMPPDKRPNEHVSIGNNIPVIDLAKASSSTVNHAELVQEILKASQEFGLFQIINHGVSEKLMDDVMDLFKELFDMSVEMKDKLFSEDSNKSCKVFGNRYINGDIRYWRDLLIQPVFPIQEDTQHWLENPARYRELVETYSTEVRKLCTTIVELIGEGLGVELGEEMIKDQALGANYYPPCPDPSSAMGSPPHCDPNIITFLQQQVYGLQIFKDGHWIGVHPLPYAFVVIIGYQMQIISNNKLVACEHRAVTNSESGRITLGTFVSPAGDCVVEPAKALVNGDSPALYRAFKYEEFMSDFMAGKEPHKTLTLNNIS
ncbi:hyoscyamine 6-dioxygenase-like [Solanum stenotomum]|uniref:hyoscyamine 6-dioxygenase-like n=1 Tax=Solanum stenotomum TaxID=172797 RepID=UPI0020D16E48|nr:hyoscyamine 6-dioxygenase-like [Solanum stenotomum]